MKGFAYVVWMLQIKEPMIKHITIYLTIIACLCLGGGHAHVGWADEFDQARQYTVDLINYIRSDPAAYALGLGITGDVAYQELPYLALDSSISEAAGLENSDEVTEELNWATSAASVSFSSVVSFLNFMSPEAAIRVIVNSQFQQELMPGFTGARVILNPELTRAGVAISVGVRDGGGVWYNAYTMTITLASTVTCVQRQLLNLVNQMRYNPVGAGLWWLYDSNLESQLAMYPPVFTDSDLQNSADALALNPLGCEVGLAGGVCRSAGVAFPKSDLDTTVEWLFSSILVDELKADYSNEVLLRSDVRNIGIGLAMVEGEVYNHVRSLLVGEVSESIVTEDPAEPVEEPSSNGRIYGLAYVDTDLNGLYRPGEGWSEGDVLVCDAESLVCVSGGLTDAAGHFDLSLPLNRTYWVQVSDLSGKTGAAAIFLTKDSFLPVVQVVQE